MTALFANLSLSAVIIAGLVMIGGVVFVANLNDPRNGLHPGGRMGRLRDELLVNGALAPFLLMVLAGAVLPGLREADWWFPTMLVLSLGGIAATFLAPAVRRARARFDALRKGSFS